jgi:nucleoside-diphosphate-sugar epimerase
LIRKTATFKMANSANKSRLVGKHYLVTGGTGFIGSGLAKGLLAAGACVRAFDNNSRGSKEKLKHGGEDVELIVGDIRDRDAVTDAIRGVDGVCHLAYINGTEFFYSKPETVLEVAVKGMINVIDACLQHGVPELVLFSSSEVYHAPAKVPTDETAPLVVPDVLNPRYSYSGGKIVSELLALNFGRKHFQRVLVLRPHNVYGPDMGWEHVIPQFTLRMRKLPRNNKVAAPFEIQGTGKETRAFIYIDDAIDAVVRVMGQGEHLGIYHIGTDHEVTIEQLARNIGHYFNLDIKVVPGELRGGSPPRRCPDISKLRELGFEPRTPLEEGLAMTVQWYDANAQRKPSGTNVQ